MYDMFWKDIGPFILYTANWIFLKKQFDFQKIHERELIFSI